MLNMVRYKDQRVVVLIDVQNMYYSAKNLYNCKVNFGHILEKAINGRTLIRAIAYTIRADVRDENNFHDALENIGFEVKLKDLLVFSGGHKKGDWDVGIAMDAVRAAEKADVIVVVSGDGDFRDLYEYVRGKGCRIEVIAFGKTASSSVKDYVDDFLDMCNDKKFLIPLRQNGNSSKNTNDDKKNNSNKSTNSNTSKSGNVSQKQHVNNAQGSGNSTHTRSKKEAQGSSSQSSTKSSQRSTQRRSNRSRQQSSSSNQNKSSNQTNQKSQSQDAQKSESKPDSKQNQKQENTVEKQGVRTSSQSEQSPNTQKKPLFQRLMSKVAKK